MKQQKKTKLSCKGYIYTHMYEHELQYLVVGDYPIQPQIGILRLVNHENQTIHDTYFDTPDQQLGARGASLRLRNIGDMWWITHKEPTEYANTRYEHEIVIPAPEGDLPLAVLPETSQAKLMGLELIIQGTLTNERVLCHYTNTDTYIHVAHDSITYPDQTAEKRVEVEIINASREFVHELEGLFNDEPNLVMAEHGKYQELLGHL